MFYTVKDLETLRSNKIKRWDAQSGTHELIFEEEDETFTCFVYKSKSRKYLMIGSSSTMADEHRFLAADNPTGEFQIIQPRERGLEYSTSHFGDHFYIRTNADEATNFKLMKAPVEAPSKENWTDVLPHDENVLFTDMGCLKSILLLRSVRTDWFASVYNLGAVRLITCLSRRKPTQPTWVTILVLTRSICATATPR